MDKLLQKSVCRLARHLDAGMRGREDLKTSPTSSLEGSGWQCHELEQGILG